MLFEETEKHVDGSKWHISDMNDVSDLSLLSVPIQTLVGWTGEVCF